MASRLLLSFAQVLLLLAAVINARKVHEEDGFDANYNISFGESHVSFLHHGDVVQLSLDNYTGSGFLSKLKYGSGLFKLRIKVPGGDTAGVITAFYLHTQTESRHDELDFEFLGNREGKPIGLQTNVFVNGIGGREQRLNLWFDPSADFHEYRILWNPHQIVFFVDNIPVRVYENNTEKGVDYPSQPMHVITSLWNGDWATGGEKTNWTSGPFNASFKGTDVIYGCPSPMNLTSCSPCTSSTFWWNGEDYTTLSSQQLKRYENVKRKHLSYDYCTDVNRYPTLPPECAH